MNMRKLIGIIQSSGYRGYLPIKTLVAGDPKIKVKQMAQELRDVLN